MSFEVRPGEVLRSQMTSWDFIGHQACNITDSEYDDAIEEEDDELDLDGQAKPSLIDIEEILALEANKFDRTPLIYL